LQEQEIIDNMQNNVNFFGLTFGAHTRECYFRLPERWVTTPYKEVPTDLYMWQKLICASPRRIATTAAITALNFPFPPRKNLSENERFDELESYFHKICSQDFLNKINHLAFLHEYKTNHDLTTAKMKADDIISQLSVAINNYENQLKEAANKKQEIENNYSILMSKQSSLKYLLRRLREETLHRIKRKYSQT
jgi:hypothetical protein